MPNLDIWGPRGNNYGRKKVIELNIINFSNRVYNIVLDTSYIG